jgi:hypothetical protein
MPLPTPLELCSNCKKIHGISNKDSHLDLYQIYTLCQTKNISLLYPDNATQIFTHVYNSSQHRIFEKFIDDICVKSYTAVIHITTVDDSPGRASTVKLYIPNANSAGYTMKKIPSTKSISIDDIYQMGISTIAFFFEYSPVPDAQFGHYGGAVYDCNFPDILCIFDSMMNTDADDPKPSEYGPIFESIIKNDVILFDYAGYTDPRVVYDLYRIPNPDDGVYPFELTGGVIETPNVYIENMPTSVGNKQRINRYMYCSDNQNQFCYMWAFLYLVIKLSPRYERENGLASRNIPDFTTFHKSICDQKIIPLAIIKTFAFHTFYLTYIQNLNIISQCILPTVPPSVEECFFTKYFRTFTAFDGQYPDANTRKKTVKLLEIPNLNPIHHTGLRHLSIFDIVPRVIEACDKTIPIRDITQVENVLSHNPFVFEFVHKQFALAFSGKKSIYTFISDPLSDDNTAITMKAFIKYASKYDDIIMNDDTLCIGVDNFKEHMKTRTSLSS